jgi:hypothetical protein
VLAPGGRPRRAGGPRDLPGFEARDANRWVSLPRRHVPSPTTGRPSFEEAMTRALRAARRAGGGRRGWLV